MTAKPSVGRWSSAAALGSALAWACNVPEPPGSSGGTGIAAEGECGRGFAVVESQYESTNVALLGLDGSILAESLVSSASEPAPGLAALSGDVVASSTLAAGSELPLIDRYSDGPQIAWIDLTTGAIGRGLALDTGFPSNPQDYAQLSTDKAYVTRFGHNLAPGQQPFDQGDDVLIIDPATPEILGSIDLRPALADDPETLPRAGKLQLVNGKLLVLATALPRRGFAAMKPARLVVIDTVSDTIERTIVLEGLLDCAGMAVSPSHRQLAVFCGALTDSNGAFQLEASGIALLGLEPTPTLERVLRAETFGSRPVAFSGAYAAESRLLFSTFGEFSDANEVLATDTMFTLDLDRDLASPILEGQPFSLGGVSCAAKCGVCVVADANTDGGVVHRYEVDADGNTDHVAIKVETSIGLPPRSFGRF